MAGRPLAKPAETTPVVSAEDQAKTHADKPAAAAGEADAAKEATKPADPKPDAKPQTAKKEPKEPKHRFEEFDATRPDGTVVHIRRNIDTGEQTVTEA